MKTSLIFGAILVAALLVIAMVLPGSAGPQPTAGEFVVFKKTADWGPCPVEGSCHAEVILYSSGRLTDSTRERLIAKETVQKILDSIDRQQLLTRNCDAAEVPDFWATTTVSNGKRSREIKHPGCQAQLTQIEVLLPYGDD